MLVITVLQGKELHPLPIVFALRAITVLLNQRNPPDVSQELTKMNLEQTNVKHAQKDIIVIPHYLLLFYMIIQPVQLVITALRVQDTQPNFPAL